MTETNSEISDTARREMKSMLLTSQTAADTFDANQRGDTWSFAARLDVSAPQKLRISLSFLPPLIGSAGVGSSPRVTLPPSLLLFLTGSQLGQTSGDTHTQNKQQQNRAAVKINRHRLSK